MSQLLSPEKYIRTKVRTLPIDSCFINDAWEDHGLAIVAVLRKHPKGTYTAGIFMVDIFCLGIKDCFIMFNTSKEEIEESLQRLPDEDFYEEKYEYVHNIIFNAIDFASSFEILPHKDFNLAKYILEPEDSIEFIETPVGDDDEKPLFLTTRDYPKNSIVLAKLRKHFGEGGFSVVFRDDDSWIDDKDEDFYDDDFDLYNPEYISTINKIFNENYQYSNSFPNKVEELSRFILSITIFSGSAPEIDIPSDISESYHLIKSLEEFPETINYEIVYPELEKLISFYPEIEDLYFLYLDICTYDWNGNRGIEVCKQLLKKFPESKRSKIRIGKYYLENLLMDEFQRIWNPFSFRNVLLEFPNFYQAEIAELAGLFIEYFSDTDLEEAEIIFEAIKKTDMFESYLQNLELTISDAKENYLEEKGIEID